MDMLNQDFIVFGLLGGLVLFLIVSPLMRRFRRTLTEADRVADEIEILRLILVEGPTKATTAKVNDILDRYAGEHPSVKEDTLILFAVMLMGGHLSALHEVGFVDEVEIGLGDVLSIDLIAGILENADKAVSVVLPSDGNIDQIIGGIIQDIEMDLRADKLDKENNNNKENK